MTHVPSLSEELNRKVLDAAEDIMRRLDRKLINQAQASYAATTLFNAVAGLVDLDIQGIICSIRDHQTNEFVQRHLFVKPGAKSAHVSVIEHSVGTGKVRFLSGLTAEGTFEVDKLVNLEDEIHPARAAVEQLKKITAGLVTKGWRKI